MLICVSSAGEAMMPERHQINIRIITQLQMFMVDLHRPASLINTGRVMSRHVSGSGANTHKISEYIS